MTSIFTENGKRIAVTKLIAAPLKVTQIKTVDSDGYNAVQLSAFEMKESHTRSPQKGHFAKANTTPKKFVQEFRDFEAEGLKLGDSLSVQDVFKEGETVDIVGKSIGKGFLGVLKRHGFSGVGGRTHGQHNRQRAPGSIGQASDPSRVFKGIRMGGRMGNARVKHKNSTIVKILPDSNLILIEGPVPGPKGRMVEIHSR